MKYTLITLTSSILFVLRLTNANGQDLKVATYNLRYDNPGDSGNLWKDRRKAVIRLISYHDFDIFGTQEGLKNQLDDLTTGLSGYSVYGKGRDNGKNKGEHSSIFFKTDMFDLLDAGDFWLSQTPGIPGLGWDATCCNRICSWVYLKQKKSGKKFYVFNAHFDHQGVIARKESSKLILHMIDSIAQGRPAIFTGDLNGSHESEWYRTLEKSEVLKDAYNSVAHPYVQNGSFNGFGSNLNSEEIIDHIFISKDFKVESWGLLTDTYHGKFPSDHFPVLALISFKE